MRKLGRLTPNSPTYQAKVGSCIKNKVLFYILTNSLSTYISTYIKISLYRHDHMA